MKLLDSTFLIDLSKGNKDVLPIIQSKEYLFTAQICMFELIRGMFYRHLPSEKILEMMGLFEDIRVLPLDDAAVVKSAQISAELLQRGMPIPDNDCLIAGIALSKNISTIVTRNVKDFQRIKELNVESY
ncbi:type II toxin-antitoxin system VapC family toxin [Candidatus Woesearchaeota archaeon]|nr:type II toxin-antitoxin system VapC family toxin [Candidatus Woesearchaeota archaeon]